VEKILALNLKSLDPAFNAVICGSYRRGLPTSGDIDVLLTHKKVEFRTDERV
jgi:DNA polymerase/3'-5' exonuclease PolX